VHFGVSLFAMFNPLFMLMVSQNLGPNYIVWNQAAHIEFIKLGKGDISAQFTLNQDQVGDVIATVRKTLYIRKK
jgi:Domain of unknown function (DUF4442)